MKQLKSFVELIVTILVAAGLAFLVQLFIVKPYRIPSGSMLPTLALQQRILVNRLDTHPGLGAIVVFHPPSGADAYSDQCDDHSQGFDANGNALPQPCDRPLPGASVQTFVKRVVGLPGDTLQIVDGHVIRNGKREADRYTRACLGVSECSFAKPFKVPAGEYYMMGDNRGNSDDSRYWGPVPQHDIIGVAFFTYWPLSRIGTV